MVSLLTSELFRLRKRPQSWLLFAIASGLTALIFIGYAIAARTGADPNAATMRQDVTFSGLRELPISIGVGFMGSIMVIIVASGIMGNEFSWNTLRPLASRAKSRASLLTAKIIATAIYALVLMIGLLAVAVVLVFIGSMIVGEPSGFTGERLLRGTTYALQLTYTNAPYMALAFMLATVARSNAAGIAGALGITFIEQPIFALLGMVSDVFTNISHYGISYNVSQVMQHGMDGAVRSSVILGAYCVVPLLIAYVVFLRRDVTSG